MQRREFLGSLAAAGLCALPALGDMIPADLKVTRAIGFDLPTRRAKFVGKNAVRGDHGQESQDRLVRLYTNMGIEAVGRCWREQEDVERLLGKNPFSYFDQATRRFTSPLDRRTMVLWDLAGRVLGKPVYQLLGGNDNRPVPVYDGSFYFSDLLPQYTDNWQDRFREELDASRKAGHRAIKVKVGRGHQWMERQPGDDRDIEVLKLIREHVGPDFLIGVDANNAFDHERARTFIDRAAEIDLAFFEEPFPEHPQHSRELKEYMRSKRLDTLLADGEGTDDEQRFQPLVDAKAVDLLQGDMYSLGIEGIMAEAAMGQPAGIRVAPHNWSSLMSLFMQVHVGLAVPNFYRAEVDPLATDILNYDGYKIQDGKCTVPDAPGFGLSINEQKFSQLKVNFDVRA
jgi:L-alanine-DL-glutamate epimerase-like enolase superfamily enzyme